MSDCENLAAERNGCMGLLLVGLKPLRPDLVELGMFTGAELPNNPAEEANPTDMEFETVGESVSRSLSRAPDSVKESSKFNSSNALPRIKFRKTLANYEITKNSLGRKILQKIH